MSAVAPVMLVTRALKKVVAETGTSRLVQETCTCVGPSGMSFYLVPVTCT